MSKLNPVPADARKIVKHGTNRIYEPVLSTEEVAEELDLPTEEALLLLEDEPTVSGKEVGDTMVWW